MVVRGKDSTLGHTFETFQALEIVALVSPPMVYQTLATGGSPDSRHRWHQFLGRGSVAALRNYLMLGWALFDILRSKFSPVTIRMLLFSSCWQSLKFKFKDKLKLQTNCPKRKTLSCSQLQTGASIYSNISKKCIF